MCHNKRLIIMTRDYAKAQPELEELNLVFETELLMFYPSTWFQMYFK